MKNVTFNQFSLAVSLAWKLRSESSKTKGLDKCIQNNDFIGVRTFVQSGLNPISWSNRDTSLELMSNAEPSIFRYLLQHSFTPSGMVEQRLKASVYRIGKLEAEKDILKDIVVMTSHTPSWIGHGEAALLASIGFGPASIDLLLAAGALPDAPGFCDRLLELAPLSSQKSIRSFTLVNGQLINTFAAADMDTLDLHAHFEGLDIAHSARTLVATGSPFIRFRL